MRTKRLIGGLCVAAAVTIAACFGSQPKESATGQMIMQAMPMSYNFGTVLVGSDSQTQTIILSNTGFGEINTLASIGPSITCPEFIPSFAPPPSGYVIANCGSATGSGTGTASGVSGSGGSDMCVPTFYSFDVKFHPTAAGSAGCTYNVIYSKSTGGSASFPIMLSGYGMPPANALSISPTQPINFGDIPTNSDSAVRNVTVTNTGGSTLTVTGSSVNPAFLVAPNPGTAFTLMPMQSQQFTVKCHPTANGPVGGSLSFMSAAPTVSVQLSCNGITPTGLQVSPVPASFPSTLVGRGVDVDVSITNGTGTQVTLAVGFASTAGGTEVSLQTNPSSMQLGSGATAHAILHYAATAERTFAQLGTLSVGYTGGPTPQSVAVNGEALSGSLGTSPGSTVDFGPVCVGGTASKDVTLYASGMGPVDITSVTTPAAPFTANQPTGTLMGNHGSTKTLTVGVAPTAPGDLSGTVTIATNIPTVPNQEVMLVARGLPAGVTPTPDAAHFGPARVMMTSNAKEVIVSNCGTAPVTFTGAHIEGPSAAEFALVSQVPTTALDTKASSTFLVVMTPQSNGQKAAQLLIDYSGGTIAVDLDGNGFGGDDVSNGDRTTYYSCSAGGPAGAGSGALLALGLLAARRRRRAA